MTIDDAIRRSGRRRWTTRRACATPKAAGGGRGFEGSVEFAQALRDAMAHASERGTRRLCWCDEDFAAWPIGEAEWIAQLTRWARVAGASWS